MRMLVIKHASHGALEFCRQSKIGRPERAVGRVRVSAQGVRWGLAPSVRLLSTPQGSRAPLVSLWLGEVRGTKVTLWIRNASICSLVKKKT